MSYGVLIGRFQPLHFGHIRTIKEALKVFDEVRILVGSANCPRSFHNPWTFEERKTMIEDALSSEELLKVTIYPSDNHWNDVAWSKSIPSAHQWQSKDKASLICPAKDGGTRKYLKDIVRHNPGVYEKLWEPTNPWFQLHSTDLRSVIFNPFFEDGVIKDGLKQFVYPDTITQILEWRHSSKFEYQRLCRELDYHTRYKTELKNFPRNELTADLCLFNKSGDKVLMIKRGRPPGELLWALPGGFVDQDETTLQAAYREFEEETRHALDPNVHRVIGRDVFDEPSRSFRARIVSVTTFAQLTVDESELTLLPSLPETLEVEWKMPQAIECFEDHYTIIQRGLELVRQSHP